MLASTNLRQLTNPSSVCKTSQTLPLLLAVPFTERTRRTGQEGGGGGGGAAKEQIRAIPIPFILDVQEMELSTRVIKRKTNGKKC